MQGYILKRSETDYVVNCDSNGQGGYNVVPREIDPSNAYTLEDVRNYLLDNPDMLLDSAQIETDRLTREARVRRDALLKEVVDAVNPMRWEALTDTQKDAWRAYRQALLDVPQQEGFPNNIVWPEAPDGQT
nr:tail fiber assembly protein [uncultured Sphaerochaeta sp.]